MEYVIFLFTDGLFLFQDDDIGPQLHDVKPNEPCLFIPRPSSDDVSFYFESVAYPGKLFFQKWYFIFIT